MKRFVAVAFCAVLLAACAPKPATPVASGAPKFNTDLPMNEFMGHVVDPAAFKYWAGSGTEETAAGTKELAPTTEQGWEDLETAAAVLIEAGNALQLAARPRAPEADWNRYAQALSAQATLAKTAAFKKDKDGVYVEGAKIYQICTACHKQYVIDPELKANGFPKADPLPPWPADVVARQNAYEASHKPAT